MRCRTLPYIFVGESRFHELKFNVSLIALDTVVLIASLIINARAETNLYLAYFLLIIVCAIFENARLNVIISLAAPFAYAVFFFDATNRDSGGYLPARFPDDRWSFYGHFSQLVRSQKVFDRAR